MPTYVVQTTINPGVSYEVDQAEYEQLRDLGLLLNNNPTPLAGVFDTEVSALVQNVNSQTYLRLTQLPLAPHTHLTTEISDSGSTGRALLKTTSALDARTAIGALAATAAGAASGVAQLDANGKVPMSQLLTAANGVATLDSGGKIPQSLLPSVAIVDFLGETASQSAMLALTGQRGDWTTRTDKGTNWQLIAEPSSTLANWRELTYPTSPVQSVDGKTGAVTLGTTAVTANELARRGSTGTLLVATATQPSEATTLAQTQSMDSAAKLRTVSRSVTGAVTLALTDVASMVNVANTAAATTVAVNVPTNASVAFPVGSWAEIAANGAGGLLLTPASGVTIRGGLYVGPGQIISLLKTGTDEWSVIEDANMFSQIPLSANVPLNTANFGQFGSGFYPLRAVRFGGFAHISGLIVPTAAYNGARNIGTLAAPFRPSSIVMGRIDIGLAPSGSGNSQLRFDINPDGTMTSNPTNSVGASAHHWVEAFYPLF